MPRGGQVLIQLLVSVSPCYRPVELLSNSEELGLENRTTIETMLYRVMNESRKTSAQITRLKEAYDLPYDTQRRG